MSSQPYHQQTSHSQADLVADRTRIFLRIQGGFRLDGLQGGCTPGIATGVVAAS